MFIKNKKFIEKLKSLKTKIKEKFELFTKSRKINLITLISIALIAAFVFFFGITKGHFNMSLVGILIIWGLNLVFGISNIKERFIFFIMNLMIFVFILSRPFISSLRNDVWWYFDFDTVKLCLISIFLTLSMILMGGILITKIRKVQNDVCCYSNKKIKLIMYIFFAISFVIFLYTQINNYFYLKNMEYSSMYLSAKEYPIFITFFASLFEYFVFFILSMLPSKKESILILSSYILTSIPSLLLGSRNDFVVRCLFLVVYFVFRHFYFSNGEVWIKKQYKILFCVVGIFLIIFLGAYNYIRDGEKIEKSSPLYLFTDFFYKQGTTFDTICQGFENREELKNNENVCSYTFGDIIDYVKYNTISKKLFNTEDLGSGNSIEMATKSNSMAHHLSYLVLGDNYLEGHGRGTSYLIEVYMDFGLLGICIYSILLGMLFIFIIRLCQSKYLIIRYISLTIISSLWLLPRYSASGFFAFIVTPQFWFLIFLICILELLYKVILKRNGGENEK